MELDVGQARLLGVHEGEAISDTPNRELRILCDHEWLTVTWTRHAAGQRGAEPHVHREHCDAFYVLQGQLTVRLGPEGAPLYATAGTSICKSMRSSSGPLIRARYRWMIAPLHRQSRAGSPK